MKQQIAIFGNENGGLKAQNQQLQGDIAALKIQLQNSHGANNGELNALKQQINIYMT